MNLVYAIGDVHGCYDELKNLFVRIMIDSAAHGAEKTTIIFLGDYIDRGPESKKVLDFIRNLKSSDELDYVFLRGNHEDLMIQGLKYNNFNLLNVWLGNGGYSTLKSFGFDEITDDEFTLTVNNLNDFYSGSDLNQYINWMEENLVYYYKTNNYLFVHAGYKSSLPLDSQKNEMLWMRTKPYEQVYSDLDFTVVHGHTITRDKTPYVGVNEINIDTGAFYSKQLTAVKIVDDSEYEFL